MPRSNLRAAAVAAILAASSLIFACGAIEDEPPVRNPLAETPGATAPATSNGGGGTSPVLTPTATSTPGTPASGGAAEAATAQAVEAMAGWLSVPQRELTPRLVEAVEWPDACLGVKQPLLCAQVVTPGYRVRLEDALGATHTVHVEGRTGRTVWAGEVVAEATVTSVDSIARRVTVQAGGQTLTLRIVPGTVWFPEDAERRAAGMRGRVAYDPAAAPATPGTAAWVALDGS